MRIWIALQPELELMCNIPSRINQKVHKLKNNTKKDYLKSAQRKDFQKQNRTISIKTIVRR